MCCRPHVERVTRLLWCTGGWLANLVFILIARGGAESARHTAHAYQEAPGRRATPSAGDNEPLVQNGTEHAGPITKCAEVADAINPGAFETRNLRYSKARCRDTDIDERLDLKAIAPGTLILIRRQHSRGIQS